MLLLKYENEGKGRTLGDCASWPLRRTPDIFIKTGLAQAIRLSGPPIGLLVFNDDVCGNDAIMMMIIRSVRWLSWADEKRGMPFTACGRQLMRRNDSILAARRPFSPTWLIIMFEVIAGRFKTTVALVARNAERCLVKHIKVG